MVANHSELEKTLWDGADQLRANSKLRGSDYSIPVLGLIFLKYAEYRFLHVQKELKKNTSSRRTSSIKELYKARGAMYLPPDALYTKLVELPEDNDVAKAVSNAMKAIEESNPDLSGVLPKEYRRFEKSTLIELLKIFNTIPFNIGGDIFGRIYEYFLSKFAATEGQRGGEFFTPQSIVKLIVEILEPYSGRIFDPACGSGGMFVQSDKFRREHNGKNNGLGISIFGRERVTDTVRLCQMNLAVHGLSGDVKVNNSYYENFPRHDEGNTYDFVMANPPFNVNGVDYERIKDDKLRFPFGVPSVDNANYVWISMFYSALNDNGRAGFVMANSASDARSSEQNIRKELIDKGVVDVMISVASNFFYTVTLPVTLWFLDKDAIGTEREDTVLFIDARDIYQQVDRAHREFKPEQLEFIANIVRLYRGEDVETNGGSNELLSKHFPDKKYVDVAGLCKVVRRSEIAKQNHSLNPGRYVGVKPREDEEVDFVQTLTKLHGDLEELNSEAQSLASRIQHNLRQILGNNTK